MDPGPSSPEKPDKENLVGEFSFPVLSFFRHIMQSKASGVIESSEINSR